MKITMFEQAPYRYLPEDFESKYDSVHSTPYFEMTTRDGVYKSIRHFLDELMFGVRAGLDGVSFTEHGQCSHDMIPNPDLVAAALAYMTEHENLDVAIFPMGRSLGKTREPVRVAEELAMIDVMSRGRVIAGFPVGLAYDANLNNGVPPIETRPRFEENLELILKAWHEPHQFAWNGRFHQYPGVNIWPRPLQRPGPPVWITGIGNPRTMEMTIQRDFGFNYLSWFGAKLTGKRIFDRFWETADRLGVERNPYRMGFTQTIAVADTDQKAEEIYSAHLEYAVRKGLGGLPPHLLALPGGIDIRGVRALLDDPSDFGLYHKMRTVTFKELVDSGVVICGSPATVREQLASYLKEYRIGNLHAMLGFGSLPKDLAEMNIQLFVDEVAPHLRTIWADSDFEHRWWPQRLGGSRGGSPETTETMAAGAVR